LANILHLGIKELRSLARDPLMLVLTVEHLPVTPVTPFEIMASKVWSMGLVVLASTAFSLTAVVQGWLAVPIEGSLTLFLMGTALHLFATIAPIGSILFGLALKRFRRTITTMT
jgi:hypothetical protein